MSAAKKLELTPDEMFLQEALRSGRAVKTEISMKALGKPDVELQARVNHLDMTHVHRLGMSLENQGFLAPVVVFKDDKSQLWMADGHHRHECYRKAGKPAIPAYQIEGTRLDALEYATMCNRENCLGRTKDDEKKALFMLLEQEEWRNKSLSILASHVGTSPETVSKWRLQYCVDRGVDLPQKTQSRDGKECPSQRPRSNQLNRERDGRYRKQIKGVAYYLGKNQAEASKKLGEILAEPFRYSLGSRDCLDRFLVRYGISHQRFLCKGDGLGDVVCTHSALMLSSDACTVENISRLVGLAFLNRHKRLPSGRTIVVCYDPPQCEALDVAKDMGIEFLTPEELVESLKEQPHGPT